MNILLSEMNKSALLTTVKKFDIDNDLYLVSFFDLVPSGIIVHAYNQVNSNILTLPIAETEVGTNDSWPLSKL